MNIAPWQAKLAMTWGNMIARCYDPGCKKYSAYGGRGITVAPTWHSFENFVLDMGERPAGYSLDRIDVNGNYAPENCRWATDVEQARNRRNTIYLTIKGQTMCATAWANEAGIGIATVTHRIRNGWSHEDAVFGRRFLKRYPGITHDGITLTADGWSKRLGLSKHAVARRLKSGKTIAEALATVDYRKKRSD